jgi:hypothetical protein
VRRTVKPWARAPFEVLLHAEMHYRVGEDFDRRISMIGFDNAIEFAIATYLSLKPIHRGGKTYEGAKVIAWLKDYHTRIGFFFEECKERDVAVGAEKEEILWVHDLRNEQYHGGGPAYPGKHDLDAARTFALFVFSVLFDEPDVETLLEQHQPSHSDLPQRNEEDDKTIDNKHGLVELCGRLEYSSHVLYAFDPYGYRDTALKLRAEPNADQEEDS